MPSFFSLTSTAGESACALARLQRTNLRSKYVSEAAGGRSPSQPRTSLQLSAAKLHLHWRSCCSCPSPQMAEKGGSARLIPRRLWCRKASLVESASFSVRLSTKSRSRTQGWHQHLSTTSLCQHKSAEGDFLRQQLPTRWVSKAATELSLENGRHPRSSSLASSSSSSSKSPLSLSTVSHSPTSIARGYGKKDPTTAGIAIRIR